MKRVLQIASSLDRNGTETFIMNVFRNMDRKEVMFDFLVCKITEDGYEEEARKLGAKIYHYYPRKAGLSKHIRSLYKFFREHASEYDAIHYNSNSFTSSLPLRMGKIFGIKRRIAHAHSTSTQGKIHRILHRLNRLKIHRLATHYLSCSEAGRVWGFKGTCAYAKSIVVRNGIEIEKFQFNEKTRENIRKQLGIADKFVVGHVSNFLPVKNHPFMLKIFRELKKIRPEAVMLFVGDGGSRHQIENQVTEMNLQDSVIFTGVRSDVNHLLQAMDAFLFPSFFEGLGITVIEAQAAGLPVFASTAVPQETNITDLIHYLPLTDGEEIWANEIAKIAEQKIPRDLQIGVRDYDIKNTVETLMNIYNPTLRSTV